MNLSFIFQLKLLITNEINRNKCIAMCNLNNGQLVSSLDYHFIYNESNWFDTIVKDNNIQNIDEKNKTLLTHNLMKMFLYHVNVNYDFKSMTWAGELYMYISTKNQLYSLRYCFEQYNRGTAMVNTIWIKQVLSINARCNSHLHI